MSAANRERLHPKSANLIRVAHGVDVLVHLAIDDSALRASATSRDQRAEETEVIIAHHTTPEQAAQVFSRVQPRLAVFSHARGASGRDEPGEDMMTIDVRSSSNGHE